jgi:hypothetical protein
VHELVQYSETTIGRIRKRMDAVLARVAEIYLRILAASARAMHAAETAGDEEETEPPPFKVRIGDKVIEVPIEALDRRWRLQVIDSASTPAARAAQLTDLLGIAPLLMEMATNMNRGQAMAEALLDHMVELADLPKSMTSGQLKQAQEPEPPPAPPGPELPPEAALPPPIPGVI